ncbi:MAG TPA: quinone-dependent dihydroorotate dehydrogenase, partial [Chitinophagales bacterium]|nr:quinone-dependent dihydroorotate dehydrogenase [Chitinophagales bacterium]
KPLVFRMQPEQAHYFTTAWMQRVYRFAPLRAAFIKAFVGAVPDDPVTLMGLRFKNRVGLAAGFDKDARWVNELAMLGFGFIEIGTVTPRPQSGNPKPRLFRLPKDEALINRMGFNNDGAEAATARLKKLKRENGLVVGGNIGKNKDTPNENAVDDYVFCFNALYDAVDYFVVNVSSPNTPGLRALQEREPLQKLLNTLQQLNRSKPKYKPLLLKIAPDLTREQLDEVIEIVLEEKLDGVIATNTTIDRNGLVESQSALEKIGAGGLSGKPLRKRATEIVNYVSQKANGRFIVIGSGGVDSAEAALEKINAGASLVQIYTGLIYAGPGLVAEAVSAVVRYFRNAK